MAITSTTRQVIEQAIRDCLGIIGVLIDNCRFGIYNCGSVREVAKAGESYKPTQNIDVHGAGVYVFFNESTIYYVGEADDVARRLLGEHCAVHIGGSEGVVRFLMHYLDSICNQKAKWEKLSAEDREKFVKGILKDRIGRLSIYIVTCKELKDKKENGKRRKNKLRENLEKCLISRLKPILQ